MSRPSSLFCLLILLAAPLAAQDAPKTPPAEAPKETKENKEKPKEAEKPKTIDETVKDYEKLPGVFTVYRKLDGNKQKLLLELSENQFDTLFLLQMTFSSGVPGGATAGTPIRDIPLKFQKTPDDRVLLVSPNMGFRVDKNSPQAVAVAREFPESPVAWFVPLAKQAERKALLIDVSDFFRANLIGADKLFDLSEVGLGAPDNSWNFIASVKNLPENLVVQVSYNFGKAKGDNSSGVKNSVQKVDYNLFPLPETGYTPRLADPRVGYFVNGFLSQQRIGFSSFDNDSNRDPRVVYINRWRLEKADPNAALSQPKRPIVFWIDKAFPLEYRVAATQGIALWNKAFERIGFKDAIVVKQMPDDADWDHADLRYNVLRWVATAPTADSAMAVALMRENPMTGEIIGANINVNANWMRFGRAEVKDVVNPALNPKAHETAMDNPALCRYGEGMSEQAWMGWQAMEMQMALAPRVKVDESEYANALLRAVVAHEMGHILGLRHNFIASTLHNGSELEDAKIVAETGISASVMDYTGFNLYALKKQGVELFSSTAGPYDNWAIEYGYKPFGAKTPADEQPALRSIASRCNEPGLAYQSDDLADDFDPAIVRYDLGKDPLDYLDRSFRLNRELISTLGERLPRRGEDYSEFTRALYRLTMGNGSRATQAARYIGGLNARRNNRGDKGEQPLIEPVPAAQQRRALRLINHYVFAADAFSIPPEYFQKLAPDAFRLGDSRASGGFPIRDEIGRLQSSVLQMIFDPARLDRMENTEFKTPQPDGLTLLELFRSVQGSVWSDLTTKTDINPLHRDLQRAHLDLLIGMTTARGDSDTKMMAWDTLRRLKAQIVAARKAPLDAYTKLHLEKSQLRIERALDAKATFSAS